MQSRSGSVEYVHKILPCVRICRTNLMQCSGQVLYIAPSWFLRQSFHCWLGVVHARSQCKSVHHNLRPSSSFRVPPGTIAIIPSCGLCCGALVGLSSLLWSRGSQKPEQGSMNVSQYCSICDSPGCCVLLQSSGRGYRCRHGFTSRAMIWVNGICR